MIVLSYLLKNKLTGFVRSFAFLLILLSLSFSESIAQQWLRNLPENKTKSELTFYDYRDAFNEYWKPFDVKDGYYYENGSRQKAPGWRQFKRWEYYMEAMVDPQTGAFPQQSAYEIHEAFQRTQTKNAIGYTGDWTVKGPDNSSGGYAGIGRLNCVAFHPSNNNIYWVGAAAGGLWQTTNNGATWTCLTDQNAVLAVSDIVIPSDFATSQTIYIATGDKNAWDNRSVGVLKSTDGGQTWNTTGLSYTLASFNMVYRLLINPNNVNELLAATSDGVFKTTNGGTTWSTLLTTTQFVDLEYQPGNWNVLLGSNTSGQIYRSSNGGASWSQVHGASDAYRTELAVSPAQNTVVYAISENGSSGLHGIYKSTNAGQSFTLIFDGSQSGNNLLGWDSNGGGSSGQGWYDLAIAASPTNANTVLIGGVNTWRSTNGGSSWSIVNHWWGDGVPAVHADKHFLAYRSNGDLFECNDGGIYLSTNNGTSWTDKTNGMQISQMYKLGIAQSVADETITGLQDNGTKLCESNSWSDVKGGDGMECIIDYSNVNIQYGTYVNGQISRTTNHWVSATDIEPNGYPGAWVTPYIIHPTNPQILYAGYADVWKTTNRGDSWVKISTMNTSNNLRSMAIAPSSPTTIYVADDTNIWKTTNDGGSWTNITGTLPSSNGYIRSIVVKDDDPNTLWVGLSGYSVAGVYESVNGGSSWTNISSGLPMIPVWSVIQNKQVTTEVHLYAGTEVGVYFKKGGQNWVFFNTGLPNVKIGELEIYYAAAPSLSKLRAATYGRGLWETNVYFYEQDMEFASLQNSQIQVEPVNPGSLGQEILQIQVNMQGNLNALSAGLFNFSTNGSSAPAQDIQAAKLLYSGSINSMANAVQVGISVSNPQGSFQINASQLLNDGPNFFWLTYDLNPNATVGNFLDAELLSLQADSLYTPDSIAPAGNREIQWNYCDASGGTSGSWEYINFFSFHTINNGPTGEEPGFYADFTANHIAEVYPGSTYNFSVTIGNAYSSDKVRIWIDWYRDGVFSGANELAFESAQGVGPFTGTITIPADADLGNTRMRVRLWDDGSSSIQGAPCGSENYGEVEDYGITILPTVQQQAINIPSTWFYFSTYLIPSEPSIATACQPLGSNLALIKNYLGDMYWPQWGVNTIGNWVVGQAYQIKLNSAQILTIEGTPLVPEETILTIPSGWSLLGYLRQSSIGIDQALSPIVSNLSIVKNSAGQSYWPVFQVNTIGLMNPGEGYQILMNSNQSFTYPAN